MGRNGAGTYNRTNAFNSGATVWAQDRDAAVNITAVRHDNHDQDIADALTASIAKNGETPITADLPMSGFKHLNVADAAARTQYGKVSQIQDAGFLFGGTSAGAANIYTITLSPAITAYANGQRFQFVSHQTNTDVATLNINGVGALAIRKGDGTILLAANDIQINNVIDVFYSSSGGGRFILLNFPGIDTTGDLTFGGGDIVLPTDGTTVREGAGNFLAAGADQAGATLISKTICNVSGGAGGLRLPVPQVGQKVYFYNTGGGALNLYPPVGGTINSLAANASLAFAAAQGALCFAYTTTAWIVLKV